MLEQRRILIYLLVGFVALVFVARLAYIQIVDTSYETKTNSIKTVVEIPPRGEIFDRNGKLIVYNTMVYDLYVTPKKVKVKDTLTLCNILGISRGYFDSTMAIAKTYSKHKPSLFLPHLSKESFARIQDALIDYEGFEPQKSYVRSYTKPVLAHALGYVREISQKELDKQEIAYYRTGDPIGKSGIEAFYEEQLRGRRGIKYIMQDVNGIEKGRWRNGASDTIAMSGKSLYLGIDLDLQVYCDSLMQHKAGAVVAIEPSTGEILAMTSAPTYDPSDFVGDKFNKTYRRLNTDALTPLLNRAVDSYYRPGSTFKTLNALIGLQEGVFGVGSVFGHAGAPVKCHGHGALGGVASAVQWSCNPYFYHAFRRIIYASNNQKNRFKSSVVGLTKWHEYASEFGFGKKLGIDLSSEKRGLLPDAEYFDKKYNKGGWTFSTVASMGIGEGELLISPLKLLNLVSTIANRGWFYTPHLVKGVGNKNATLPQYLEKHKVSIARRYFEPVINGMEMAVVRGTVSPEAYLPGVQICGKTGTSQNPPPIEDHSIFIAFAPKYKPKIAIAVFVENAGYGGFHAAPVASLAIEKYLNRVVKRKAYEAQIMAKGYNYSHLYKKKIERDKRIALKKQAEARLDSIKKDSIRKDSLRKKMTIAKR